MCGFLPLGLSCASLVVSCCVMGAALRSAKARFCLLVATLTLMMGWVWTGILLAALHPFFFSRAAAVAGSVLGNRSHDLVFGACYG